MWAWLRRLVGDGSAGATARAAPRAATPSSSPATPLAKGTSPAAAPDGCDIAATEAPQPAFGLRRPLVDARGGVAGFEFVLPPAVQRRLQQRRDPIAEAAHGALLLSAARATAAAGRQVLIELPAATLSQPAAAEQVQGGLLLLVPDLQSLPAAVVAALRARGALVGTVDGPPAGAPAVDFVALRSQGNGVDTLLLSAQRWQEARPRLRTVATGLAGVDEVERVLKAGFWLAGGELGRSDAPANRPLTAAAHRICELMNHLVLDRGTATVSEAVRADVALSYRLLRYANSPAIGSPQAIDTVEQAVLRLGRKELMRWLSVLLMSAADGRQASAALQETALARGRLLELLGRIDGEAAPEALFSMGLLSMLEVLLKVPLLEAVAPLRLGEAAMQALLQAGGPWAAHLALAQALEAGDAAVAEELAQRWGGLGVVQALADSAWAWAVALRGPGNAP